jgi:hypothetical protein
MPCPIYGRDFSRLRELHAGPGCWSVTLERRYLRVAADTKPRKSLRFRRDLFNKQNDGATQFGIFDARERLHQVQAIGCREEIVHVGGRGSVRRRPFAACGMPDTAGAPSKKKGTVT